MSALWALWFIIYKRVRQDTVLMKWWNVINMLFFWKVVSDRTTKGSLSSGRKRKKSMLRILACWKTDGSEKFPLFSSKQKHSIGYLKRNTGTSLKSRSAQIDKHGWQMHSSLAGSRDFLTLNSFFGGHVLLLVRNYSVCGTIESFHGYARRLYSSLHQKNAARRLQSLQARIA